MSFKATDSFGWNVFSIINHAHYKDGSHYSSFYIGIPGHGCYATWLCIYSHQRVEAFPFPPPWIWVYLWDWLWPTAYGRCNGVPLLNPDSRSLVLWPPWPATMWKSLGQPGWWMIITPITPTNHQPTTGHESETTLDQPAYPLLTIDWPQTHEHNSLRSVEL